MRGWLLGVVLGASVAGCGDSPGDLRAAAQACHEDAELSCVRPILNVRDLQASFVYYKNTLGFTVDWEHGDPPDFGSVSRGDATIFLCEGCQGNPGAWMMLFARDLDSLYDEFQSSGAIVRMPPKDMPWKTREMHISDHDGNVIRFANGE